MSKPALPLPAVNIGQAVEEAATAFRQGRLDRAEKICTRLLKSHPGLFDAQHILGLVKLQSGKPAAALGHLEAALKLDPRSTQAMSNLAMALAALNRDVDALAMLDRALAIAPDEIETLNNHGNVLLKVGRAQDALTSFERVIALEPRFLPARASRGNALARLGRFEEALADYEAVLTVQPSHAETHFNRGTALSGLARHEEAVAAFDRALALRPDYPKALVNRAAALHALNRYGEMIETLDRVLAHDKNNADARHNRALALLATGDYRRGFADAEWRWQRTGMPARRRIGGPLWRGEYPLGRKSILLHAEQGLGDTIQYVRYVPLIARAGAAVVLEVHPELKPLLSRLDGASTVVARGEPLPAYDVQCPLGSLPLALKTERATVPADVPYLKADAARIAKWRERLAGLPSPRVAIAWAGNAGHANDRNRSIALEKLMPLFANERVSFVGIQRDLRDGDAGALAHVPRLVHLGGDLDDFDDTAAVASLVDLVVSVDTAVVHLAGALARPTWVLTPFCPDWRWGLAGDTTPWYPTARIFRQPKAGDWDSVIARVKDELSRFA
jgi:tetratricopeptide (TPR) repeat protein